MPAPLLGTKLYLPRPRPGLVPRPRLTGRLEAGAAAKVMLVSAPAGFGKTTLLSEWLAAGPAAPTDDRSAAWLSLDRGDNDPATFWSYLIAALRTAVPDLGTNELALLALPQPPPIQLVLTTLLNDLSSAGPDVVLVLDDYHLIESREVEEAMGFLLDNLPPRLHLVIAGRADPAIPLARLRARGDLVEIRAAELRFAPDEVATYLDDAMGVRLTVRDVAALEQRTEGWIAALQLAALSMQGRDDVSGFIAGFAGDDRYVVDYLAEEVLQRQAPAVRDFLMQTALLSRLNGPLCDAVTGTGGGRAMLETLDRANLFVVPLDDRRESYRYHHLFADMLRARLLDESPGLEAQLHRRASDWYEANGERSEAIEHAFAAGHHDRAADLVELALPAMRRDRTEATMRTWLEQLPAAVVAVRPVLSNAIATTLLAMGDFAGVDRHLRDAERWLDDPNGAHTRSAGDRARMVVSDPGEFRRLPAAVAIHRAGLSLITGDGAGTVAHARRAVELADRTPDLLQVDHDLVRAAAGALIGLASWSGGDLDAAREAYAQSLSSMRRAGHVSDVLGLSIALADIQITQGRLREATRTFEQALQLASEQGPAVRGLPDMCVGLSTLYRERDDLPSARALLARSAELGEQLGLPQNPYRWRVASAGIRVAEGDLKGAETNLKQAEALLAEAERVYVGDFSPDVRPVPATRARIWIRQGRVADALEWARGRGLSAQDDLDYLHEYEHVTLARALLRSHGTRHVDEPLVMATALLGRLLEAAEAGGRTGSVIEIIVLQALAQQTRGDLRDATACLERALELAEPEGYARVFLDEGAPMATLLAAGRQRGISPDYVDRLLSSTAAVRTAEVRAPAGPGLVEPPVEPRIEPLIEPLSPRELDVLRLLGSDLSGPEIARHLVVSLNTVRTHTKNIYAKLAVTTRRAAVRRAAELDLI